MNTNTRYIANMLFGDIKGLRYIKKNLKYVLQNSSKYEIIDIYPYGYKFITIKNDLIYCNEWDLQNKKWKEIILTLQEFWDNTKHRKNNILLIEKK